MTPWTEVYRDPWLLVVDKPSGLPTQRTKRGELGLIELIQEKEEAFLHHRLDQPASGLIVFSLDGRVNAPLSRAMSSHTIFRGYQAVLSGPPASSLWKWPIDGQPARSHARVVGEGNGLAAVALTLDTGRTHQLRRHAAHAGTPILGDRRYGGEAGRAWPRLALHAASLSFAHPITGEPLDLRAPCPSDLADIWRLAGGPDRVDIAPDGP